MSLTHLLDTSVYCQPLRKKPLPGVIERWQAVGEAQLCISVVCLAELLTGLVHRNSPTLHSAYDALLKNRLPILDMTSEVAEVYADLAGTALRKGKPRPSFDLLIASTAKVHQLTVATCNLKDFAWIEGLAVEDWSKPLPG